MIARSFARIHETHRKKQGMLPLTFGDMENYDRIKVGARIEVLDLEEGQLKPGKQVLMKVTTREGEVWHTSPNHTFHVKQMNWLRAGSALNHTKKTTLKGRE